MKEKILSSQIVFEGTFLKVNRDHVVTAKGCEAKREFILHPGASLIIPVLENGMVVMERQYRHALKQIFLEFPSGKWDANESPLSAAQRELKEETGFTADKWTFLTRIHPVIGYSNEIIDIFMAEKLKSGPSALDADEDLQVLTISPDELMQKVRDGNVSDVKTQIAAFWLEKLTAKTWSL